MAKYRHDRNARVDSQFWTPRQLDDLDNERQLLLEEARAGSRRAHEALLSSYWPVMRAYFGRRLSRKLAAKVSETDLAQSAALLAWRGFPQFAGQELARYRAWLMRICHHLLATLLQQFGSDGKRDLAREETLVAAAFDAQDQRPWAQRQSSPDELVAALETWDELQSALAELPPDERQIVTLRLYGKLAFAEIARRLEMSNDAVERCYQRALQTLRRRLAQSDGR